ncbi:MAG: hypothetical protein HY316_10040 [Acidobacteria bacterium]|nr:hypothetical protein [Acidobacteriota bacterium]
MKNLFVGNLPFRLAEADLVQNLRTLFEGFGTVDRVSIITDRETGKPRGFAFVEMADADAADKAIAALNGADFEGRALNVSEARPRMDREGGARRSGGGGELACGGRRPIPRVAMTTDGEQVWCMPPAFRLSQVTAYGSQASEFAMRRLNTPDLPAGSLSRSEDPLIL